jgi:hypothetical protein
MGIHNFPLEILERVYRHLDPASHLDFALTDKHIFYHSQQILEHHRECHQSYQTCSVQSPESLFSLLRIVTLDHIAAWHIRIFEGLNATDEKSSQLEAGRSPMVELFCSKLLANSTPLFGISRVESGDQEALQTTLLTLCYRIHTIKSTRFFPALGDEDEDYVGSDNLWHDSEIQ